MLPRLGSSLGIDIEVVSRPRAEYFTTAWAELNLPKAPAIMVGGEVLVEGRDIDEGSLEAAIRRLLDAAPGEND